MRDERLNRLGRLFLTHSLNLEKGDGFLISASVEALPLVRAILEEAQGLGVYPLLDLHDAAASAMRSALYDPGDPGARTFLDAAAQNELERWNLLKGQITLRAVTNDSEAALLPQDRQQFLAERSEPVRDRIINERKWVLFYWPTPAQAQKAGMPYARYFDYTMDVCDLDYPKLLEAEERLAGRMRRTDRVRIEGPGTSITFSIKDMPVVCSYGLRNLPDGEVFTAPVADSAQGEVTYNVPSTYRGHTLRSVRLTFDKGVVVSADCDGDRDALVRILDSDAGARRLGEFSFGVNPLLKNPVGNTLFDEKISGSFHLTPGNAYARADNGNRSAVHWDLVCIQRPEFGGGRIWLDDTLVREDGRFLPDDLEPLNPAE